MQAYHNDPAIKAKYVARFAAHRAADDVIQGQGFSDGRGCFVGCTLDAYDHARFPVELGWPEWLARLADTIFEGLPKDEAPQFGTDLLNAVPVGADLDVARDRFLLTVQRRNLDRLEGNSEPYANEVRAAVGAVIALLSGESPSAQLAEAAAQLAEAAAQLAEAARSAEAAAWSAEAAAWSAARAVAWSAWSAWSAARSARAVAWSAESAAESAAWSAEYETQRDDLLAVIRECGGV